MPQKTAIKNFLALIALSFVFASCEKEDQSAKAVIIVQDVLAQKVEDAIVEVYPDSGVTVNVNRPILAGMSQSGTTDVNGRKEFSFPFDAILRVKITKYDGNDTLRGIDVIRLVSEKTETKTIEVY